MRITRSVTAGVHSDRKRGCTVGIFSFSTLFFLRKLSLGELGEEVQLLRRMTGSFPAKVDLSHAAELEEFFITHLGGARADSESSAARGEWDLKVKQMEKLLGQVDVEELQQARGGSLLAKAASGETNGQSSTEDGHPHHDSQCRPQPSVSMSTKL